MAHIVEDVVSYEHDGHLQYVGTDEVRKACQRGLDFSSRRVTFDVPDLTVHASGDLAVSWGLDRIVADGVESRSRGTRIFQRRDGGWQVIHQHCSSPATDG